MTVVRFLVAVPLALVAIHPFASSIKPLPAPVRSELEARAWHEGCPVPLSGLRLLTVTYWGFDQHTHRGQLVVNGRVAPRWRRCFSGCTRCASPSTT